MCFDSYNGVVLEGLNWIPLGVTKPDHTVQALMGVWATKQG